METNELKITGHSDDIIDLEGSISDEIYPDYDYADELTATLAFPSGDKIEVYYDENGLWRIDVKEGFSLPFTLDKGNAANDENDVLTIHQTIEYVLYKSGEKKGVRGEITLAEAAQKTFDQLDVLLSDSDFEYDGNENLIKAILAGKFQ
jgi:hypothetical protein